MKSYFDIAGDGGSDVAGQVAAQRVRIEASLAGVRHMVAIGSGKGGVGKSTLTMQLAAALAGAGKSVAVFDADLNGPSQARLAGLGTTTPVPGERGLVPPKSRGGIGVVSLGTLVPESRAVDFESVASGESYTWRATREFAALGQLLAGVEWGDLDALLVDLPPGAERTAQIAEFLGPRAAFVLVTIPSRMSWGVVRRSAAALAGAGSRVLGYVENMKDYHCPGCGEPQPLFPEAPAAGEADLGVPCLGGVPFDPELAALCDRGETIAGRADLPSARAVRAVAGRLVELLEGSP